MVTCGHRSRIVTSADWAQGRRVWGSSSVRRHGFEGSTAIGFGSPPGQARATKSQHTKSHCSFLVEARASRVCRTSESRGRLRAKEESHHCLTRSQSRAGGAPPPTVRHPPPTRAEVGGTRAQPGYGTLLALPATVCKTEVATVGASLITPWPRAVMDSLPEFRPATPDAGSGYCHGW